MINSDVTSYFQNRKSPTQKIISTFNMVQTDSLGVSIPKSEFHDMIQFGTDDLEFFFEPFLVIPRLLELQEWMLYPSKNTNWWCFWKDAVARLLAQITISMVVGDGVKVRIFMDRELKEEDEDLTASIQDWLDAPCGPSGDNRGKTLNNWILPMVILDNYITGGSALNKFIGYKPVSPPEEVGKLMLRWLDPRSYVKVYHDFTGQTKLIQFPKVQWNLPETREEFDSWMPAIKNRFQNLSGYGHTIETEPVHIQSDNYYWFNLFIQAPLNTGIQHIISKLTLQFLRDRFVEKATFPFFVIKVPRNQQIDSEDEKFKNKLAEISELMASYRAGDALAIEGEMYDVDNTGTKITLSEGWEIIVLEVKTGSIDFESMERMQNEEIAHSMMSSMALISSIGVQGRSSTLTTGGHINQNVTMIVKNMRQNIAAVFKYIIRDVIEQITGKKIDTRLIDIAFSKIREEDASQFLNQLISYHGAGGLTTNELRAFADRIGMNLKPLPPEMTPEGQSILKLEEILDEGAFQIPPSWLKITSSKTRLDAEIDELDKAKEERDSNIESAKNESK
jgi:hypothetical protein